MDPKYLSLIEMTFTVVFVLGLLFWQLWSVNREMAKDRVEKKPDDATSSSPGHPVGEHTLDDR